MSVTIRLRRNADLTHVGEVDDFKQLELVLKFNEPSKWVLTLASAAPLASQFGPGMGIIVERDDVVLLSGPVESVTQQWDENGDVLTVSGSDDSVHLSRRIVFPSAWQFTADDYDKFTDSAETVLHYYVNKNAGPGADPERRVPGLLMSTDNNLGSTVSWSGRFQQLNDLLKSVALAGGDLRYQILQVDSALEFQVLDTADRTDSVQFSPEFENLKSFTYERTGPTFNYVYVGGGGVGTGRVFRRGDDSPSVATWGLSETFRDRRDTTTVAELTQTITEELAENSETTNLLVVPIDTSAVMFGTHYNLGDRVRVITPSGLVIEDAIRELTITYTGDGAENVQPVVGTPGATHPRTPAIYKKRRYIEKRTRDLERV